jgi:hypothetical protein
MRTLFLFSLVVVSITPAFGMTTKEKVRMILWVKGIKEQPTNKSHVVFTYPEEIERPLRKF